ncbi:hypothetical protein ACFL5U_00955 [Candidatus Margulisiibacteriota bacterium]
MFKNIFIFLMVISLSSQAFAYMLNTSEIIGWQKMVLQVGYANENFGSQATASRSGMEFKLGYGFNDPWDGLLHIVTGSYPDVSGQTYQAVGLNVEYGLMKAKYGAKTPVDVSLLFGTELAKVLSGSAVVADETTWQVGGVVGKSLKHGSAYATPYVGSKIGWINPASNGSSTDYEILLGFKYGFTTAFSLIAEGSYHWVKGGSSPGNSAEWGMGAAWSI